LFSCRSDTRADPTYENNLLAKLIGKNKSKITQIELCRLTLKHFTACGHKIWVRKETCSHAFADLTYKSSSCYSSPVTSGSFVEPLRQLWRRWFLRGRHVGKRVVGMPLEHRELGEGVAG